MFWICSTFLPYIKNQDTILKEMRHSPRQTITMPVDWLRISIPMPEMYSLESSLNSVRRENKQMKRAGFAEVVFMQWKEIGRRDVVDGSRMILRLQASLGGPLHDDDNYWITFCHKVP